MTTLDQRRDTTPNVTFHGHDGEAPPAANYHAHTSSNELATFTHPTTHSTHTTPMQQPAHLQQQQLTQPMATQQDTSSRRNSYDDAVINKTTQLYAATPRSKCDSLLINICYTLGALGVLALLTWMIVLLFQEGKNYMPNIERNYMLALMPFLYHTPYFFAALAFVLMAGKRNTTLAWFLVATSNLLISLFWLLLIVPAYIHYIYPGNSQGDASCPDNFVENSAGQNAGAASEQAGEGEDLCRVRKGAAALSCALAAIHFSWFLIGLIQTIRHWKTIIVLDAAYPSKQMWLLLMLVETAGLIIWVAGNLRLTYLGKDDIARFSDQILWNATYMLSLLTIVALVMTAYAILDASKLYVGITFMFHLCATMMLWAVFVWAARWANEPLTFGLVDNQSDVNKRANKVVAAGLGIVTITETIFTVLFAIAYKVMPDLFLTQPNITGPQAV